MAIIFSNTADEIIIEQNGVVLFKATQNNLEQFIIDAKQIADYILIDVTHDNISEDETPNLDVDTYRNFGFKYGEEEEIDQGL